MYGSVKNNEREIRESAVMLIRFDSYRDCVAKGKVRTLYYDQSFGFESLDQLLMILDEVLDSVGFEKEFDDFRHLYECSAKMFGILVCEGQKKHLAESKITDKDKIFQGDLTIRVLYRQHNSMQGELRVGERAIYFRSSLELLKLLYEFLEHHFHRSEEGLDYCMHIAEER